MDFITSVPLSKKGLTVYDVILVIVDRYSKMLLYVLCYKTYISETLTQILLDKVVCYYRAPKGIVSDRSLVFTL